MRAALVASTLTLALGLAARPAGLPDSTLAVPGGDGWTTWWRADRAPRRWAAVHPVVAGAVRWTPVRPGVERAELPLAGTGEAWRLRVVLVRLDPRRVRLALHAAERPDGRAGPWSLDAAPDDVALAVNAGHFTTAGAPWGWVVHEGRERRAPGHGPLAPAVIVDSSGAVRIVAPDSIAAERARLRAAPGAVVEAFQSYPTLLASDGEVPAALADSGRGLDVAHRDGRLALGVLRDGRVVIALTRFEGLGGALDVLPFGLTVPEAAALMGALGCERAVLLDGGLSAQLLVRDARGRAIAWRGLRKVALGLVGTSAEARVAGPPSGS